MMCEVTAHTPRVNADSSFNFAIDAKKKTLQSKEALILQLATAIKLRVIVAGMTNQARENQELGGAGRFDEER